MYTGTIFNWHDNSGFEVATDVVDTTNRPLFMVVNSFDKGPEKLMEVDANSFNTLFGNMSYERHGQASIQAQKIINAGGRLLVKRVCANNSGLANSVLVATITGTEITWDIKSVPSDPSDLENENTPIPKTFNDVKSYALNPENGYYTPEATTENGKSYPLFVITDIGRGESIKAVRIIPDYDTARGLEKMIYKFNIYEGTTLIESSNISFDPSYQFNGEYYGLDKNRMTQVTGEVIPEIFEEYLYDITKLIYPKGEDEDDTAYELRIQDMMNTVSGHDLINVQTYKGTEIDQIDINGNIITHEDPTTHKQVPTKAIEIGDDSKDFNTIYGNRFAYAGSYGIYGKSPAKFMNEHSVTDFFGEGKYADIVTTEQAPTGTNESDYKAYRNLILDIAKVYYGYNVDNKPIDEIWDTDAHKLFAVMDANYHKFIKDAIANFVEFRKDCLFLRDSGIGYYSISDAQKIYRDYTIDPIYIRDFSSTYSTIIGVDKDVCNISDLRSKFIADYGTTYEIVDPGTKKNIEVTMLYDMAEKLTTLYIDQGPFAPLAGTYNGFELNSAIEGTINFTPIITPTSNQKQAIDDLRLNYAIFEDEDTCVVQSNYTSQDKNTQLSFINNVLAIQEVARVVRTVCPRNRFRLITGSDMSEYANAVSRVLQGYNTYFETLEFIYTEDPLKSIQKIFYASINFSFNNWAQTEIFDLYALANTTTTSNNS